MKINSFKASGVQGYLNYNINFFDELTFLIGINGSGKTTALKLLLGLLSPSYEYLNSITFTKVELICSSDGNQNDILISAISNEDNNNFRLSLKIKDQPEVASSIHRSPTVADDSFDDDLTIAEKSRNEKFENLKVTQAIRALVTPKFLGLDRRVYEGRTIDNRIRHRRMAVHSGMPNPLKNKAGAIALDSSLRDVQYLVFDYFRKIASRQPEIGNEFKRKIFSLSFNFIEDYNITQIPTDDSKVREKKEKVLQAVKDLDLGYLTTQANLFFDKMIKVVADNNNLKEKLKSANDDIKKNLEEEKFKILTKWFNNSSQLKRIDEIIDGSQVYQNSLASLREPVRRFEQIITKFFSEGNKTIKIENAGEIVVKLANGKTASVFELSSGEKQIIIMIAHLVFSEDSVSGGIFIIDEPELSLHIAWQEVFVDSILEASPDTQFILATHSPSIIAKLSREKFCQDISKSNQ